VQRQESSVKKIVRSYLRGNLLLSEFWTERSAIMHRLVGQRGETGRATYSNCSTPPHHYIDLLPEVVRPILYDNAALACSGIAIDKEAVTCLPDILARGGNSRRLGRSVPADMWCVRVCEAKLPPHHQSRSERFGSRDRGPNATLTNIGSRRTISIVKSDSHRG